MHWTRRRTLLLSGVGLSALLFAACSSDTTAPGGAELSAATSADAAAASQDETEEATESFTLDGAIDPAGASLSSASMSGASFFSSPPNTRGCATVSSTTDTDADGAPDNAVFTFALPACHFTGFRGGSVDLTGTITVSDPTPSAPDFAYHAALADFTFAASNADQETYTAVRNGTRELSGTTAGLTLANNITTVRTVSGRPSVQVVHNLQFMFTPDGGGSLVDGQPLPSGTITAAGTVNFSRGSESRTFTVTTATPLQYDATCTGPHRARIKAGEIHWTLPSGGYVNVVWTACGVRPTRTFVPAT